jgi:adenosylcobinamide hydrolase
MAFESVVRAGALQVREPGTRWLSTGFDGGFERADAAYNVSVPEGWDRTDLDAYVAERRERAGFDTTGPALLTGVEMQHAKGARSGPVVAYATVGVSNPAALPMAPGGGERDESGASTRAGTVNVVVGTERGLVDGALANLATVAAEAKAATLLSLTGFPGTTTDAVLVGAASDGEPAAFSGSATPVGAATRACVRDAVRASFRSRYADKSVPESVADAEHGVRTDRTADVFEP